MEQAKGHSGNNIITVLMGAKGIDLQAASDYVGEHYAKLMKEYMAAKAELGERSFGSKALDEDVWKYVNAMENWPIGNLEWSFKTNRWASQPYTRYRLY